MAEDETIIRGVITQLLRRSGYRVIEAEDGATALRMAAEEHPAVVVMDVNMPEMGGFEALETMRRRGLTMPILLLSTHGEPERRINGLGLGADDFLPKPFDGRELVARVAALLRRGVAGHRAVQRLSGGEVTIDLAGKRAERAGRPLALTATEFSILEVLAREEGRPVSREKLLDAVWGYTNLPKTRTVETHIWRLRKKLGDQQGSWIQNKSGLGYLLGSGIDGRSSGEVEKASAVC